MLQILAQATTVLKGSCIGFQGLTCSLQILATISIARMAASVLQPCETPFIRRNQEFGDKDKNLNILWL